MDEFLGFVEHRTIVHTLHLLIPHQSAKRFIMFVVHDFNPPSRFWQTRSLGHKVIILHAFPAGFCVHVENDSCARCLSYVFLTATAVEDALASETTKINGE